MKCSTFRKFVSLTNKSNAFTTIKFDFMYPSIILHNISISYHLKLSHLFLQNCSRPSSSESNDNLLLRNQHYQLNCDNSSPISLINDISRSRDISLHPIPINQEENGKQQSLLHGILSKVCLNTIIVILLKILVYSFKAFIFTINLSGI